MPLGQQGLGVRFGQGGCGQLPRAGTGTGQGRLCQWEPGSAQLSVWPMILRALSPGSGLGFGQSLYGQGPEAEENSWVSNLSTRGSPCLSNKTSGLLSFSKCTIWQEVRGEG